MEFNDIFLFALLLPLCISSVRAVKAEHDAKVYLNYAMAWSGVALMAFCGSVMMLVIKNMYLGAGLSFIFVASFTIAMKFKSIRQTA